MSAGGWRGLERPHAACTACGRRFDEGAAAEPVEAYATLEVKEGEIEREDLCGPCFEARKPRPHTYWKRTLQRGDAAAGPEPGNRKKEATEALVELFERFEHEDPGPDPDLAGEALPGPVEDGPAPVGVEPAPVGVEPAPVGGSTATADVEGGQKLRYLVALALVRRRKLELVDLCREGGADCLVLKRSGAAEVFEVPAPAISEQELERLLADLARELEAA